MELLQEIKKKINTINCSPEEMYANIKQIGTYMIVSNSLSKDNVVTFCSNLIKLYETLKSRR